MCAEVGDEGEGCARGEVEVEDDEVGRPGWGVGALVESASGLGGIGAPCDGGDARIGEGLGDDEGVVVVVFDEEDAEVMGWLWVGACEG